MRQAIEVDLNRPWPLIEQELKRRYLQRLLATRKWTDVKSLAAEAGISAPTVRSWLVRYDLSLPGEK